MSSDLWYSELERGESMISYMPLWRLLLERNLKRMDLVRKVGISTATLARISKGEHVALSVIERICSELDCRIEDVVEIKKGSS